MSLTRLERHILEYVEVNLSPSSTKIAHAMNHCDAMHAIMALTIHGLLKRHPHRAPYKPHRYELTEAGREALRNRRAVA